jgi:hypothetical protein
LHVLGTPPAFILSQDQTLHKKNLPSLVEHETFYGLTDILLKQFTHSRNRGAN